MTRDIDWEKVFDLRCRSKRGERLSDDQAALLVAAWKADKVRYSALTERVFEETAPMPGKTKHSKRGGA